VYDCRLTANSAGDNGGGAADSTLIRCVLRGNRAGQGGGTSGGRLIGCALTGNVADGLGGGSYASTCIASEFRTNGAAGGGGVALGAAENCVLSGNSASGSGGGAFDASLLACRVETNVAGGNGGGAHGGALRNCRFTGNSSRGHGGGSASAALANCALADNSSSGEGGGSYHDRLENCTLTRNWAAKGGGISGGWLWNCIVYHNRAHFDPNYYLGEFHSSCTAPLPAGGNGIGDDPRLADCFHVAPDSRCIGAGARDRATGMDIDGQPWKDPPSIGCDEFYAGMSTGALRVTVLADYPEVMSGFGNGFVGQIEGHASRSVWFADGAVVASNRPAVVHGWSQTGLHTVALAVFNDSSPAGVVATAVVRVVEQRVHYVDSASLTPESPYDSWTRAARTVQDAIDVATVPGSLVLVTNGVYDRNGAVAPGGHLSNRVAIVRPITVRSVNGAGSTFIVGAGPAGDLAARCAYVGTGARLEGFTLTNGHTRAAGAAADDRAGGGVWCEFGAAIADCRLAGNQASGSGGGSCRGVLTRCVFACNGADGNGGGAQDGVLENCVLLANSAGQAGGGMQGGKATNCRFTGNVASDAGGGAYDAALLNCTLTANSAAAVGGGTDACTLRNCIVYYNSARESANCGGGRLDRCATTPPRDGTGCVWSAPLLADAGHLAAGSPCVAAGRPGSAEGRDIDGQRWGDPPSIGCDEYYAGSATGEVAVSVKAEFAKVVAGQRVDLWGTVEGQASASGWFLGEGPAVSNRPYLTHEWHSTGVQDIVFWARNDRVTGGVFSTVRVDVVAQSVRYAWAANATPQPPYDSWSKAACRIQDAVDAADVAGATVLVTNGVYAVGGRAVHGSLTNRVAITRPLILRSVGGPRVTVIRGEGPAGDGAVRCVYLGRRSVMEGFTLTNGATRTTGDDRGEQSGGGLFAEPETVVRDCVFAGNRAVRDGGGAFWGWLRDCALTANSAEWGGGAYDADLADCTLTANFASNGGGAFAGRLTNCVLADNVAQYYGGGCDGATLAGCTLRSNLSQYTGGGSVGSLLSHCVLRANSAAGDGGGSWNDVLRNCLLTANTADGAGGGVYGSTMASCTVAGNSANWAAGGAYAADAENCIVYHNDAPEYADWVWCALAYSCAPPPGEGEGVVTNDPGFRNVASGDWRLRGDSLCVDRGINTAWMSNATDMAGEPRLFNGKADMGAFEFTMTTYPRLALEGAWGPTGMSAALSARGLLPARAPYGPDTRTAERIPAGCADWVLFELRDTNSLRTVAARSAFLRSDGAVLNEKGQRGIRLEASPGRYYLGVKHRNHLAVMSARPLDYTAETIAHDFAADGTHCFGGTNACVEVAPGVWALRAGDVDGDGAITGTDARILETLGGATGYVSGDIDLDGAVRAGKH
jgi:hypothetical protein